MNEFRITRDSLIITFSGHILMTFPFYSLIILDITMNRLRRICNCLIVPSPSFFSLYSIIMKSTLKRRNKHEPIISWAIGTQIKCTHVSILFKVFKYRRECLQDQSEKRWKSTQHAFCTNKLWVCFNSLK